MNGVMSPEMSAFVKEKLASEEVAAFIGSMVSGVGTGFALPEMPGRQRTRKQTRHAASMKKHSTMKEKVTAS